MTRQTGSKALFLWATTALFSLQSSSPPFGDSQPPRLPHATRLCLGHRSTLFCLYHVPPPGAPPAMAPLWLSHLGLALFHVPRAGISPCHTCRPTWLSYANRTIFSVLLPATLDRSKATGAQRLEVRRWVRTPTCTAAPRASCARRPRRLPARCPRLEDGFRFHRARRRALTPTRQR